jgi:hypothetical protein
MFNGPGAGAGQYLRLSYSTPKARLIPLVKELAR